MRQTLALLSAFVAIAACSSETIKEVSVLEIGPAGGTIRSTDGIVELEVPPLTLTIAERSEGTVVIPRRRPEPVVFVIETLPTGAVGELEPSGYAETRVSRSYLLEPAELVFRRPAQLRFRLQGRSSTDELVAAIEDPLGLERIPSTTHRLADDVIEGPLSIMPSWPVAIHELPYLPCARRACGEGCSVCSPSDGTCRPAGARFCDAEGACVSGVPACGGAAPAGWDDPPGTGSAFIVSSLTLDPRHGFDLDGFCHGFGACVDNLFALALGASLNDLIQQALLGGESMLLLEIRGSTLKIYSAQDADDPFFPSNNFSVPAGETTCCEFVIGSDSLTSAPPQARTRLAVRIEGDQLSSVAVGTLSLPIAVGVPPHSELRMERVLVSGTISRDKRALHSLTIGGAMPAASLAAIANPFCSTVDTLCDGAKNTMLDLVAMMGRRQLDVDLDGDGLEILLDTDDDGRIDVCLDGCIGTCVTPEVVPPMDPADPTSCVLHPEIADGYSFGAGLSAVAATIVGIR